MSRRQVLVVEDDPAIRRGLVDALEFDGYHTVACGDGKEGLEQALGLDLDLVILDVILPHVSGFEVLVEVRRCRPTLPVIMVTAKGAEADRVFGLQNGADDYVVKPFSAKELLARVEAVLRRSAERPVDLAEVDLKGRRVDFARREITRPDGSTCELSEREADLLRYLASSPTRAVARSELLQNVWGLDPAGLHTRTVDMHVARLRDKLADDSGNPQVILTVRGKGYKLGAPPGGTDDGVS
jgi:DNA-binding response OmpR family regulator